MTFCLSLGAVRWALSPMHEAVSLARLTTEPHRHPGFGEWLRRRQPLLQQIDLAPLTRFMADDDYRPDFLEPPPHHPRTTFDEQMEDALQVPPHQALTELWNILDQRGYSRTCGDDPVAHQTQDIRHGQMYFVAAGELIKTRQTAETHRVGLNRVGSGMYAVAAASAGLRRFSATQH